VANATKEPHCFENCKAKDGRVIRLTKKRYDEHIIDEHPDLVRDFSYPVSQIENALQNAETIQTEKRTIKYIGPVVKPDKHHGFSFTSKQRRMHVVVFPEGKESGHVVTAFSVPIEPKPRS
jgi:hypothetical protein